jgi:hypothetical protein
MRKLLSFAGAFVVVSISSTASGGSEVTITAPVLSVYEDGFRVADEKAQAVRVDAWGICGDQTREHIKRGDRITVTGDRDWRFVYATSIAREDGSPACPANAAPRY